MTQSDPIQAQLIKARRNQILDAATRVFADKGFHKATIRDVAKDAGIADGTIYNYFENKPALLLGILDRLNETDERESHFEEAARMDIYEWTRSYFHQRLERIVLAEPVMRVVISEVLTNRDLSEAYMTKLVEPTFTTAEAFFKQWIEAGVMEKMDAALVLRAISGMALGLLLLRMMGDEPLNTRWEDISDIVTKIVLNGVLKKGANRE